MATVPLYLPLDVSRNEIRLVILKPSRSFKTKAICSLVYRSLDSEAPFEAVSYTWGDVSSKRPIFLSGRKFMVTENLDTALRHLRYTYDERVIWIDALCINQDNTAERAQQVTKMREIYGRATKVVVWLGTSSYNTNLAFDFLAEASSKELEIEDWLPKTFKSSDRSKSWKAFHDLATRDYWKRVWIIQEIFSASAVIVRCGFRCMRWSNFIFLFISIMNQPQLPIQAVRSMDKFVEQFSNADLLPNIVQSCYIPASIEFWRKKSKAGEVPSLEVLLFSYRNSLSTDPKDKVFGIVGMAGQYDDQRALKIDYSISKRQIYIETIRCLIERGNGLEKGPLNAICYSLPHHSHEGLPSWVPDWSPHPNFHSNAEMGMTRLAYMYNANGTSPPDPKIKIEEELLIVEGLEIATVDHFGAEPAPLPAVQPVGPSNWNIIAEHKTLPAALKAASRLAMSNSPSMPHSRKSLETRKKELARTLLCNHGAPTFDNPDRPPLDEAIQELSETIISISNNSTSAFKILLPAISTGASKVQLLIVAWMNLRLYRFCVSSGGSFLMAPSPTHKGDIVCVLIGCDMPVILRKRSENHYIFIGECYAHGIMQGEAMKELAEGKYMKKEFRIH
jgi:hypothetical protein